MSSSEPSKPVIFLLALDHQPFFDEMFAPLIDKIAAKAVIKRAMKADPAVNYLQNNAPRAVFITDAGITNAESSAVRAAVKAYLHNGGTVVVGGHFSSFVKPMQIKPFFEEMGLKWDMGDYHRTTVYLNKGAAAGHLVTESLVESYSQKAVFLKGVAGQDAVYSPNEGSRTESRVFAPQNVDTLQTPVAFAKAKDGWVGYVGDVNAEEESNAVYMAMFGL